MEKLWIFVHYPEDTQLSGTRTSAELLPGPKSLCVHAENWSFRHKKMFCLFNFMSWSDKWQPELGKKIQPTFWFSFQDFFPPHTSSSATGILSASCSGATFWRNRIFHMFRLSRFLLLFPGLLIGRHCGCKQNCFFLFQTKYPLVPPTARRVSYSIPDTHMTTRRRCYWTRARAAESSHVVAVDALMDTSCYGDRPLWVAALLHKIDLEKEEEEE